MEISRRSFFKGMLAITAVAAVGVPALADTQHGELVSSHWAGLPPTLHGDGVTDDTDALNALFAGEMVHIEGENIIADEVNLIGGAYRISGPVRIHDKSNVLISRVNFVAPRDIKCALDMQNINGCVIEHVNFTFV